MATTLLAGAALSACGSSDHVNTDAGSAPAPDGGVMAMLGQSCNAGAACGGGMCLTVGTTGGLCSALCTTDGDCGGNGHCSIGGDGGVSACFRTCSSKSDCPSTPCIWQASIGAGLCEALPATFCSDTAATNACNACLGQHCCDAITACAEDVACAQGESTAGGTPGNALAAAVAACASGGNGSDGDGGASCSAICARDM